MNWGGFNQFTYLGFFVTSVAWFLLCISVYSSHKLTRHFSENDFWGDECLRIPKEKQ